MNRRGFLRGLLSTSALVALAPQAIGRIMPEPPVGYTASGYIKGVDIDKFLLNGGTPSKLIDMGNGWMRWSHPVPAGPDGGFILDFGISGHEITVANPVVIEGHLPVALRPRQQ